MKSIVLALQRNSAESQCRWLSWVLTGVQAWHFWLGEHCWNFYWQPWKMPAAGSNLAPVSGRDIKNETSPCQTLFLPNPSWRLVPNTPWACGLWVVRGVCFVVGNCTQSSLCLKKKKKTKTKQPPTINLSVWPATLDESLAMLSSSLEVKV